MVTLDHATCCLLLTFLVGYVLGFGGGRRAERAEIADKLAEALGED